MHFMHLNEFSLITFIEYYVICQPRYFIGSHFIMAECTLCTLVQFLLLANICLFAGMPFVRAIVLNIQNFRSSEVCKCLGGDSNSACAQFLPSYWVNWAPKLNNFVGLIFGYYWACIGHHGFCIEIDTFQTSSIFKIGPHLHIGGMQP